MTLLLDTSIVIHLRDGDPQVRERLEGTDEAIVVSVVTLVELEGGIDEGDRDLRRARLSVILEPMGVLTFGEAQTAVYGEVIRAAGYSRRKVLDRMIAAQALVSNATLVTRNAEDFRDIPGLDLLEW